MAGLIPDFLGRRRHAGKECEKFRLVRVRNLVFGVQEDYLFEVAAREMYLILEIPPGLSTNQLRQLSRLVVPLYKGLKRAHGLL